MTPYRIAWTASVAAIGLAVLPVFFQGVERIRYDSEVAVLTATLIALIWYTYHTHQSVEEARKAPERQAEFRQKSLMAALLPELREVAHRVTRIFPYFTRLHAPVLRRAVEQVEVFDKDVAEMVAEVATAVHDIVDIRRARAELYRQAPPDWNERDKKLVRDLQKESKDARRKVRALIAELERRQSSDRD